MKKLFILVGVLIIAASTSNAQELNLDQVLDKYYKATGFEKLQNVKTIILTGTNTNWVLMPLKIYRVRPNKLRIERDVNDITGLTVYDGQNGWITAPWTRNPNPQVLDGTALSDAQIQADFDGALYNWNAKGHKAELIGLEKVGDANVYRIKLIRSDNLVEFYLIDSQSFLILKKLSTRNIKGKDAAVENIFSDYRSVDGVMFPYVNVINTEGQPSSEIQYETIEINQPIDDKLFTMPTK